MEKDVFYHVAPFAGFTFPNETEVPWSELIVIYPYITGLVAGAFVISSLHHVFGMERFAPISRFALLTSLCFMFFAPTPLLFHLGQPTRALNAVITPHWTSAMAAFGYVAGFYVCLLLLEVWFSFRADIVAMSKSRTGIMQKVYQALTLGSDDVSPRALHTDHTIARRLAMIGIPGACGLHGYVGFLFGSLKTREWWSSDLMPIIFLLSAIGSGVGLLIVIYVITSWWRKKPTNEGAMQGLLYVLWSGVVIVMVIEALEMVQMIYKAREGVEGVFALIEGPIHVGMTLQWGGSLLALLITSIMMLRTPKGKTLVFWLFISGLSMMIGVLAMRWNVVIGGQELSKTMRGLMTFHPEAYGRESLITVSMLFTAPFVTLYLAQKLLPTVWEGEPLEPEERVFDIHKAI
ncbi:MAG: NrfD/PsrC family molybdoenzyme membrane anchor subunit [Gallionella sp.]|nr:NrfD/PsrC family molybdoenzyme membrane anchor subunit [Gallionella sp.]